MDKKDLLQIKEYISKYVGSKVKLESSGRNNKSIINEGIILNAYPSIFTIKVNNNEDTMRTLSYSYIDVLTNSIIVTFYE